MQLLSHTELFFGLFSVVGAGILIVIALSKSPRFLRETMADRVRQSIAVLDTCAQPLGESLKIDSTNGSLSSRNEPLGLRR